MKRLLSVLLLVVVSFSCAACTKEFNIGRIGPGEPQMRAICELATMDCYYHNVAKYDEKDATHTLWWTKDRRFWVEYSGIVKLGIDTSQVKIKVNGDTVKITIPPAKVLGIKVDESTLTEDSFYVDKDSAAVKAEHQTEAFRQAEAVMLESASNDTALLASAQQRAQKLLEDYVVNIGICTGKTYTIEWVYLDDAETLFTFDLDEKAEIPE